MCFAAHLIFMFQLRHQKVHACLSQSNKPKYTWLGERNSETFNRFKIWESLLNVNARKFTIRMRSNTLRSRLCIKLVIWILLSFNIPVSIMIDHKNDKNW